MRSEGGESIDGGDGIVVKRIGGGTVRDLKHEKGPFIEENCPIPLIRKDGGMAACPVDEEREALKENLKDVRKIEELSVFSHKLNLT